MIYCYFQPIYKSVMNREHEIIMLLNKGRDMLSRSSTRTDTRNLQRDLDKIQQAWDRLRKDVHERHTRLQTCMVRTTCQNHKFSYSTVVI